MSSAIETDRPTHRMLLVFVSLVADPLRGPMADIQVRAENAALRAAVPGVRRPGTGNRPGRCPDLGGRRY